MVDLAVRGEAMAAAEAPTQPTATGRGPLWEAWENLEVPPGCHAEILQGKIIVSPAPTNKHNLIQFRLIAMLNPVLEKQDLAALSELAVYIAARDEVLIPDLVVVAEESLADDDEASVTEPDDILLVAEITSPSSVKLDRQAKRSSYASAGIPVYLLIDRHDGDGKVKLHTDPNREGGYYAHQHEVVFGDKLWLPDPFGIKIDTSRFIPKARKA